MIDFKLSSLMFLTSLFLGVLSAQELLPEVKTTPDESREYRNEIAKREMSLPPEQLNIGYILGEDGRLLPANISATNRVAYLWKDVQLTPDVIPFFYKRYKGGGSFLIYPIDANEEKYELKEINPPIRYVDLGGGQYSAGYFDRFNKFFYRWSNLEYTLGQLPEGAQEKGLILDANVTPVTVSVIPPPAGYGSASTPPTPTTSSPSSVTATPSVSLPKTASQPLASGADPPRKAEQSSPPWMWGLVGLLLAVMGGVWWKFLRK